MKNVIPRQPVDAAKDKSHHHDHMFHILKMNFHATFMIRLLQIRNVSNNILIKMRTALHYANG